MKCKLESRVANALLYEKAPNEKQVYLNFFCSLKSLAVAVWIINPTSKKKLGSNLNGTNIWDFSYIMVFFQTYQLW